MADVCILIVFMAEFMDPQGAAEPEVATHNISAVSALLMGGGKYFYVRIHILDVQFCSSVFQTFIVFCFVVYIMGLKAISPQV